MSRHTFTLVDRLSRAVMALGLVLGLAGPDWPIQIAQAAARPQALQPGTETPTPSATSTQATSETATATVTPTSTASDTSGSKATVTQATDSPLPRDTETATPVAEKPTLTLTPTSTTSPSSSPTPTPSETVTPTASLAATDVLTTVVTATPEIKPTTTQAPSEDRGVIDVSKGGQVVSASLGITLTVPGGSKVDETTLTISITREDIQKMDVKPPEGVSIDRFFSLEARGASDKAIDTFDKKIELTLDVTDSLPQSIRGHLQPWVGYIDEKTGEWVRVEGRREDTADGRILLHVETNHFSPWGSGFGDKEGWIPLLIEPSVALFTGSAAYSYPLEVPAGRGGLQPNLALSYNSRAIDGLVTWTQGDWAGLGWEVGAPYISRDWAGGSDQSANCTPGLFRLVVDGRTYLLLRDPHDPVAGQNYMRYFTQERTGIYIERHNTGLGAPNAPNSMGEYWIVRTPDGRTLRFGWNGESELIVRKGTDCNNTDPKDIRYAGDNTPSDALAIMWRLDKEWDTHANAIDYSYEEEKACHWANYPSGHAYFEKANYLRAIKYNYSGSGTTYYAEVWFDRATRSSAGSQNDWFTGGCGASGLTPDTLHQNQYLTTIRVLQRGALLRKYELGYEMQLNPSDATRLLKTLTQYGAGGVNALPPVTFSYQAYANKTTRCGYAPDCGVDDQGHTIPNTQWDQTTFNYSRLSEVNNGYGGRFTFVYEDDNSWTEHNAINNYRVIERRAYDGIHTAAPGYARFAYEYSGACYNHATPSTTNRTVTPIQPCPLNSPEDNDNDVFRGYEFVRVRAFNFDGTELSRVETTFYTSWYGGKLAGQQRKVETLNGAGTTVYTRDEFDFYNADTDYTGPYPNSNTPSDYDFYAVHLKEERHFLCSNAATCTGSKTYYRTYDSLAQVVVKEEYLRNTDGTPLRSTETGFAYSNLTQTNTAIPTAWGAGQLVWIINRPRVTFLWAGSVDYVTPGAFDANVKGKITYQYDRSGGAPLGVGVAPIQGDLTVVSKHSWTGAGGSTPSASTVVLQTERWYDAYGNVYQERDLQGRGVNTTWDTTVGGVYPTVMISTAGLSIAADYDFNTGLIKSTADEAGQLTGYLYDVFGRLKGVYKPGDWNPNLEVYGDPSVYYKYLDVVVGDTTYKTCMGGTVITSSALCSAGVQAVVEVYQKPSLMSNHVGQRKIYDGLGREIQTHSGLNISVEGQANRDILVTRGYDALGRTMTETVPYSLAAVSAGSHPYSSASTTSIARSTLAYNGAGWITSITAPNGTVTSHYYGVDNNGGTYGFTSTNLWQHAVVDPNGHVRHDVTDGLGRTVVVREFSGAVGGPALGLYGSTSYQYDVADRLSGVTDAASAQTTITYNPAGQKIAMTDPDLGKWVYAYDASGNLYTQTDNRGCVTTLLYDSDNRPTSKSYANSGTNSNCATGVVDNPGTVTYSYVPANTLGAGQILTLTYAAGRTAWTYNSHGLIATETRVYNNTNPTNGGAWEQAYQTSYQYDSLDRLDRVTYPNGEVVKQNYSPDRGLVTGVQSQESAYGNQDYARAMVYDVAGRLTSITFNNNVVSSYVYSAWNSGNQGGQLIAMTTVTGTNYLQSFNYTYDNVGNILSITEGTNANQVQTFTYDHLDRLKTAATSAVGDGQYGFTYDYSVTGNLRQGDFSTIGYGASQPGGCVGGGIKPHAAITATVSGANYAYSYDCNGNMMTRAESATYTQKWDHENRLTSVTSAGQTTSFVYDGYGQRITQIKPDGSKILYVGPHFEVKCTALASPTITSPSGTIYTGTVTINWTAVTGAANYWLTIDDLSTQGDDVYFNAVPDTSQTYTGFVAGHQYQVWVHSRSDCNVLSPASPKVTLTVSTVPATLTPTNTTAPSTVTPTRTPTVTSTRTPTATATRTATPTATSAGGGTQLTRQIAASSDDVNEDGATFDSTSATVWLGTGASTSASYAGFRFTNVSIPQGATISSAKLQVYVPSTTWIQMDFTYAAENTANSATFSSSSKPSQRTLTTQTVTHSSNTQWVASTWYDLDEINTVVQPVISRADWASGNALTIVLKGTGSAYARKSVTSFDGTPANAVRLVITYTTGGPTPTRTSTATVTATATRTSTPTATSTGATCSVLDNFNRANGAIGSGWSGYTATTQYQIASNQLDVVHTGDAGIVLWNATSFGATQQVCVKLAAIDSSASEITLVLKSQSSSGYSSGILEVFYYPSGGIVQVWTYDSSNGWVQRGGNITVTFAANDTFRAVARANGQVEVYKNTTQVGTADASAWTYSGQGGYIGLWSYYGPNTIFDDFGGGTYSGSVITSERAWNPFRVAMKVRYKLVTRPSRAVEAPAVGREFTLYYAAGGKVVAFRTVSPTGSSVHYLHTDHLGSSSLTTGSTGVMEQPTPVRYYPFGGIRTGTQGSLTTQRGFTGQYNDEAIGLMYYNARYYDSVLGRFISGDSLVTTLNAPQALNRYSYVRNSPLALIDPSGHKDTPANCSGKPDCNTQLDATWTVPGRPDITEENLVYITLIVFAEASNGVHSDEAQTLMAWVWFNRQLDDVFVGAEGSSGAWEGIIEEFPAESRRQSLMNAHKCYTTPGCSKFNAAYANTARNVRQAYSDYQSGERDPANGGTEFSHQDRFLGEGDTIKEYPTIFDLRADLDKKYSQMAKGYTSNMASADNAVAPFGYALSQPFWDPPNKRWLILSVGTHPCASVASCGPAWVRDVGP